MGNVTIDGDTGEVLPEGPPSAVLQNLSQAALLLEQARTVPEVREVRRTAEAARVLAAQMKMGTRPINYATRIKLEAEIKLADMVDAGQEAGEIATHGGDRSKIGPSNLATYEDLGVSPSEVAEARALRDHIDLDVIDFDGDKVVSWSDLLKRARAKKSKKHETEARAIVVAEADASGSGWTMLAGDFRDRLAELPDGSVDLIVTDPPYPAEFMHLWSDLSKHAARVLRPQGVLAGLTGQIYLPDVMNRLGEHLQYGWVYVQPLPGSNSRIMGRHALQAWKPWVVYSNGAWPSGRIDWHEDVLQPSDRTKSRYRWEQDSAPAEYLIEVLCPNGGIVLDPFTGTGSYGLAALARGRQFIGCEMDAERFDRATERLAAL